MTGPPFGVASELPQGRLVLAPPGALAEQITVSPQDDTSVRKGGGGEGIDQALRVTFPLSPRAAPSVSASSSGHHVPLDVVRLTVADDATTRDHAIRMEESARQRVAELDGLVQEMKEQMFEVQAQSHAAV